MNTTFGTLGLGPEITAQQATNVTATKPNVWDTINNALTKVVQPAANIYTQIKTNQPASSLPSPSYMPSSTQVQTTTPAPEAKPDNTKKYLLIGGGVILAGGIIYMVTRKKTK